VVLSALALVALSPLLLVIAALIKATSPGPVLYSQQRMGRGGRPFRMWKFRTMVTDADAQLSELWKDNSRTGAAFKLRDDPRVTPLGRLLRKTSIDELPQLINVLLGDMSIVGPRPLPLYEAAACTPAQDARLAVRPGLTCSWQVVKDQVTDFDQRMQLDVDYVTQARISFDLLLIWRTFAFLTRGVGDA
jgi:lipopolysaccharide/colanic/teichoic acid biosynthesis glycosyltransferase